MKEKIFLNEATVNDEMLTIPKNKKFNIISDFKNKKKKKIE